MPHLAFNAWIYTFLLLCPCRLIVEAAQDPTWDTISYKQRHCFGLLYSHMLELHKGESCVKIITSPFQTINILWVCWAPSHKKRYYSISTHRRTLSKSRNSVGAYQILKSHQSPHRTCSLGLDAINPWIEWTECSVSKWLYSHVQSTCRARGL